MERKKINLMTKLLICALGVAAGFGAAACKDKDTQATQGPKGEQGVQGEQGLPGKDADLSSVAFLVFDTGNAKISVDPMLVNKGEKVTLPVVERSGYRFGGWYHGTGKEATLVTDDTAIDKSMALNAKWIALMEVVSVKGDNSSKITAGETCSVAYTYPVEETENYMVFIDKIVYEGEEYTEEEAQDANLIVNAYMQYSLEEEFWVGIMTFGKTGEYTVYLKSSLGEGASFTTEVAPPDFEGAMTMTGFKYVFGDDTTTMYYDGAEATYYKDIPVPDQEEPWSNVPLSDMETTIRVPYNTEITVIGNGIEADYHVESTYSDGSQRIFVYIPGDYQEGENTLTVICSHEYYGTISQTFTVYVVKTPPEELEVTQHSWTKLVVAANSDYETLSEAIKLYATSAAGWKISSSVVNEAGEEQTGLTFENSKMHNNNIWTGRMNVTGVHQLPVGKYTLKTTVINSSTDEVIKEFTADFEVVADWEMVECDDSFCTYTPGRIVYEIASEITAVELSGVQIAAGETKTVQVTGGTAEATLTVAEGKSTLTMVTTFTEAIDGYGYQLALVKTVIGEESFFTCVEGGPVGDIMNIVIEESYWMLSELYILETYYADELANNVEYQEYYQLLNEYLFASTPAEWQEFDEKYDFFYENMSEEFYEEFYYYKKLVTADKTVEEHLSSVQASVLEKSLYDDTVIQMLSEQIVYTYTGYSDSIFDEETTWTEELIDTMYYEEALLLAGDGILVAEALFGTASFNMLPSQYAAQVAEILQARTAWSEAILSGADNERELRIAYVSLTNDFMVEMMSGYIAVL